MEPIQVVTTREAPVRTTLCTVTDITKVVCVMEIVTEDVAYRIILMQHVKLKVAHVKTIPLHAVVGMKAGYVTEDMIEGAVYLPEVGKILIPRSAQMTRFVPILVARAKTYHCSVMGYIIVVIDQDLVRDNAVENVKVEVYCGEVRLITREQWGARPPNGKWYMSLPVDLSFIHHTVGSHCYDIETCCEVMRATQNYHMDSLGWSDIGYSFLIGEDGNAYEGRGWGVIGAHTSGYNDVSHGISFMGTYTTDPYHLLFAVGLPTYNMLKYTVLVVCLIVTVYGDWACRREQGTCQNDSLQCEGHYESRLCNGDVRRRCCVPNSDGEIEAVYCGNVRLITRQQWRARSPRRESHMSVPVGLTFIHHTAGRTCYSIATCSSRARAVQNYHMNIKGWKDIGYSFLIGQDGNAYEGRGWGVVGAHTYGFNSRSHGIAFMGNFNSRKPNAAALQAAKNLIQCGIDENKIKSNYFLYGHRDVKRTECPGRALYQEIKSWPN
uniref:Peptidoglycan recognition protein 3-like n=1 Tax=Saccoglossus kowalevskii TaxID=10224 RepID=A0ABM0M8E3_SACKO|nr:PREDICTED: peptidoglycan recognition protein 3-like [Saccoglossus kowalevskii]